MGAGLGLSLVVAREAARRGPRGGGVDCSMHGTMIGRHCNTGQLYCDDGGRRFRLGNADVAPPQLPARPAMLGLGSKLQLAYRIKTGVCLTIRSLSNWCRTVTASRTPARQTWRSFTAPAALTAG